MATSRKCGTRPAGIAASVVGLGLTASLLASCAGARSGAAEGAEICGEVAPSPSVSELNALARVIKAGVRTAMLAGDGLTVRDYVQDLQQSSVGVSVALYAASGERVYAPPGPPPPRSSLPASVQRVLETQQPTQPAAGSGHSFAILNEERCKTCHPSGNVRAVMTLELAKLTPKPNPNDALIPLGQVVEAAFDAMMTLGKSEEADAFMNALPKEIPGIKTAAVFSRDGRPSLGDGFMEIPADVAKRAVSPVAPFTTELPDKSTLVSIPLPNAPRCLSCHKPSEMRGAIVMQLDPKAVKPDSAALLLTTSLKRVMLTGLGRLTKKFLTDANRSGLFSTVVVHDGEGRVFHDINWKPSPPAEIAEALRSGQSTVSHGRNDVTVVLPIRNDDKCRRCHDEASSVRAVIAVTRSPPAGAREDVAAERRMLSKAFRR